MSDDAFEDSGWYQAGRIRERRERAELDAAVKALIEYLDDTAVGVPLPCRRLATRVRELMKKAGV